MTEVISTETSTEAPAWNVGVAEEHKSAISGFSDTAGLAKGYSELFSKMGTSVNIPTEQSSDEDRSSFYRKLGRPDTPEGYTIPSLGEGQEVNKEFFGGMSAVAHEAGMSSGQFDKMVGRYMEFEKQVKEAELTEFNRYREEADRKLHETYGADYDKNIELSSRAYVEYASDDLKELLSTDKFVSLRNEPAFIDMLVNIGKKNMDDTFVKSEGQVEKEKDDYVPGSPNSPEMYEYGEDDDAKKARAFFRKKGHIYSRTD